MSIDLSPEERAKIVAERADAKYGPFASLHEAYGVLAEELWELDQLGACPLVPNTNAMLLCLHEDDTSAFVTLALNAKQNAINVRKAWAEFGDKKHKTNRVIDECIDVIAVCDRIIAQWGEQS